MLEHPPHDQPPAREALFDTAPTITAPAERHWYVPGEGGYCLACNLPQRNGRHAPREWAA